MLEFAKVHRCALAMVFIGALVAALGVRGIQWMIEGKPVVAFSFVQLALAMPGAWILGTISDPLLWKLPQVVNLAVFEVIIAAGFALNAMMLTLVIWHRRATGHWWRRGEGPASGEKPHPSR